MGICIVNVLSRVDRYAERFIPGIPEFQQDNTRYISTKREAGKKETSLFDLYTPPTPHSNNHRQNRKWKISIAETHINSHTMRTRISSWVVSRRYPMRCQIETSHDESGEGFDVWTVCPV